MYLFGTLRHTGVFRNRQRGEVVLISYSALTFKTNLTHFYKVPTIIQINIILIVTCSMSHGSCHTLFMPHIIRWKTVSKLLDQFRGYLPKFSLEPGKISFLKFWIISSQSTHENVPKERSPDGDDIPDGTDSKTPKTTANQDDRKSFNAT